MATVKDLSAYLLKRAADTGHFFSFLRSPELPSEKLARLVFLCDWKHSLDYGGQITDLEWSVSGFDSFGEVLGEIKEYPEMFELRSQGHVRRRDEVVRLVDESYQPQLEDSEKEVADDISEIDRKLNWAEFSQVLYSTYPLLVSQPGRRSNLAELANEYKRSEYYRVFRKMKESKSTSNGNYEPA